MAALEQINGRSKAQTNKIRALLAGVPLFLFLVSIIVN
jgi:hypothetical protein